MARALHTYPTVDLAANVWESDEKREAIGKIGVNPNLYNDFKSNSIASVVYSQNKPDVVDM